jgi:hypothetical protein
MQQAHDLAMMMRDLLARLVRVKAEVEQLKDEKRRMEEEMTLEKKEGMRRDKEMEELKKWSAMAEEKERSVGVKEVIEAVVHKVERNNIKNGVEAMETMKTETRDMKRAAAEVMNRLEEERRREPRIEETGVKMVVKEVRKLKAPKHAETSLTMTMDRDVTTAKGVVEDCNKCVILTDSNGVEITQESVRRHILGQKRQNYKIRVHTTHTLLEAFSKICDGKIEVKGKRVIVDVTTNDLRGTRGMARVMPEEVVDTVGKVVAAIKDKGAKGVVVCEAKPMSLLNVTPFTDLLQQRCLARKIGWCQTQLGIGHLKEDGNHILPSFFQILDATYACAVMGVPVPHPTPTYRKWRHHKLPVEWPRLENAWRSREEERKTKTDIP